MLSPPRRSTQSDSNELSLLFKVIGNGLLNTDISFDHDDDTYEPIEADHCASSSTLKRVFETTREAEPDSQENMEFCEQKSNKIFPMHFLSRNYLDIPDWYWLRYITRPDNVGAMQCALCAKHFPEWNKAQVHQISESKTADLAKTNGARGNNLRGNKRIIQRHETSPVHLQIIRWQIDKKMTDAIGFELAQLNL